MKRATLALILVVTLTNAVRAQSTSIADKNNPQSVLHVFQIINDDLVGIDVIVDSLKHNKSYEVFIVDDTIMYNQEEYSPNYSEDNDDPDYNYETYAIKHYFTLDTVQNVIEHYTIDVDRDGNETSGFGEDHIYRLINSAHKTKFLSLGFGRYDGVEYGIIDVSDFDPRTGRLSGNDVDKKIFAVEIKDFFKESTPDSVVKKQYTTDFNIIYLEKEGVAECRLSPYRWEKERYENTRKWLKGDVIHFDFVDGKFIRSGPYFEHDKNE